MKKKIKSKLNRFISGFISAFFNKPKKLAYARAGVSRSGTGRKTR